MPQEIGPAAQRRLDMKRLAITELEVKTLRKLAAKEPAEARWRIDHEAKMQKAWTDERTAYLRNEVFGPPPPPPRPVTTGSAIQPHGNPGQAVRGDKVG